MSICLQIGQCGNQLGESAYDLLYKSIKEMDENQANKYMKRYFYKNPSQDKHVANAIMIDMEPKVIENLLENNKNKEYIFSGYNSLNKQEGSGNSWAYGYYTHGPECDQEILKKVKHMSEKFDNFSTITMIQSMAGGTGSGLGSYAVTSLKDEFPKVSFVNFMVSPKSGGEVILQNYNSVFSLATVYEHSDFVFLLQNDRASQICKKILGQKNINLESLNLVLRKNIVSTLLCDQLDHENYNSRNFVNILKENLTKIPKGKLIGNKFIPQIKEKDKGFLNDTWFSLTKRAFQMVISGQSEANVNYNLNPKYSPNLVKTFGNFIEFNSEKQTQDQKVLEKSDFFFNNENIYHKKLSDARYKMIHNKRNMFGLSLSMTILTNSQEFNPLLEKTFEKAKDMFSVGAYQFQYEKHGLERETMIDLFHYYKNIIEYYNDFQLIQQVDYFQQFVFHYSFEKIISFFVFLQLL